MVRRTSAKGVVLEEVVVGKGGGKWLKKCQELVRERIRTHYCSRDNKWLKVGGTIGSANLATITVIDSY